MVSEKKFCSNCGNPLESGARFCPYCGSPLSGVQSPQSVPVTAPVASPPQTAPAAPLTQPASATVSEEKLIGVIPLSQRKGLFKFESFSLLVTEKRMIFALITNTIMKEQAAQLHSQGFAKGLGSLLTSASATDYISKRYFFKSPEDALKENAENFAIDRSRIKKVKVHSGFIDTSGQSDNNGKLEIETLDKKLSFMLKDSDYSVAKAVLKQIGM